MSCFLGHSESLGCNKCLIRVENPFGQSTNHSGIGCEHGETHCHCVQEFEKETTKTGIVGVEEKLAVCYSILPPLPYSDPVRFNSTYTRVLYTIYFLEQEMLCFSCGWTGVFYSKKILLNFIAD